MKAAWFVVILVVFMGAHVTVRGAVVPGRWEKVESLERGTPIIVTLESRDRFRGSLIGLSDRSVFVENGEGVKLSFLRTQVNEITGQERVINDSVVDGLAWGTAVGAVAGLPWLVIGLADGEDTLVLGAGIFTFTTVVGAGASVLADALTKSREIYYLRPGEK